MRKKIFRHLTHSLPCRILTVLLCAASLLPLSSPAAVAADAILTVYISDGGKTVKAAAYNLDDLEAIGLEQQSYSSLNSEKAPVTIIAEGVTVSRLLDALSIPQNDVQTLAFSATDGWSRSCNASAYIYSDRYFYSGIISGYDIDASEEFESPTFIEGAENNRRTVPAMLAVRSYEGRFEDNPSTDRLSETGALRFCHGQSSITDAVMLDYGKNINGMTITLKSDSLYALPEGEEVERESASLPDIPVGGMPEELDTVGLKADTMTITVGYYGGTYYTKKVFTYEEMVEMSTVQQVYSYIDNMPAVCLTAAVGVPLTRLLEEAGVDINSVQSFNFFCADVSKTWYTSIAKTQLLDTPRFYYPNLPTRWDYDEMQPMSMATADAVEVETILAVSDKWRRFATELDFSDMTDSTRYRLVFGQANVYDLEASRSAKWVHTIAVTLGGVPPKGISTDFSVLDGKVGSTYSLSVNVEKTDDTTDTRVTWSSRDESIAKVDKHGRVTIVGEGDAVITVTTVIGGLTQEIGIHATLPGEENEPEYMEVGAVIADGNAPTDPPDQEISDDEIPLADGPDKVSSEIYKVALGGTMPEADETPEGAAVQNWRSEQMSPDAAALTDLMVDSATLRQTAAVLSAIFAASIAARIIKYRLEIDDVRQA